MRRRTSSQTVLHVDIFNTTTTAVGRNSTQQPHCPAADEQRCLKSRGLIIYLPLAQRERPAKTQEESINPPQFRILRGQDTSPPRRAPRRRYPPSAASLWRGNYLSRHWATVFIRARKPKHQARTCPRNTHHCRALQRVRDAQADVADAAQLLQQQVRHHCVERLHS